MLINEIAHKGVIIDIAIPTDYNILEKKIEKIQKHGDLAIEIKKSCHLMETITIPVIKEPPESFVQI